MRSPTYDKPVTVRFPREARNHADEVADRYGVAVSDLLRRGLQVAVEELEQREPPPGRT